MLGTFHSFGVRILREQGKQIGLDKNFVIYDQDDQTSLMRRAIEAEGLDPRTNQPGAILHAVSSAKNMMLTVVSMLGRPKIFTRKSSPPLMTAMRSCFVPHTQWTLMTF